MTLSHKQIQEIDYIKRKRKREAAFMSFLDFMSVVATLFCVYSDALSFFGIALVWGGPITLGVGLTIGVFAFAVIAGAFWARKRFKGFDESRKKEVKLMEDCFELENKGVSVPDNKHVAEPTSTGSNFIRWISKGGNRVMSFATGGFSTMLGMAGVVFGIFSITFAPVMPAYLLAVFIGVAVFAVAFGIAYVAAEYYLSRSQEKHIEVLGEKKVELEKADTKMQLDDVKLRKKQQKANYIKQLADKDNQIAKLTEKVDAKVTDVSIFKQSVDVKQDIMPIDVVDNVYKVKAQ